MKKIRFKSGQVIFKEGDRSLEAYRILAGKVQITIAGESKPIILAQLGDGDIFGEMGMVDERPRSASAQAMLDTECEVMTPSDFQVTILQNPQRLLPYLATFFERLRTVTNRLNLEMRVRAHETSPGSQLQTASKAKSKLSPPVSVAHHPERTRLHTMHAGSLIAAEDHSGLETITFSALNALSASKFEEPFGKLSIEKFPFRIGRLNHEDGSVFSSNDFSIPDKQPFQVSRNHCSIEREGDHYFVRDRGSTLGTIVNGVPIGVQHGTLTVDLKKGENILILGSQRSPYKFRIDLA
ncbi:MAG: cyclic nucleotide-binding domain-containing protein [Terrimicrobiaceae bacterium]